MGIVYLKFEYNWGILLINLATIPTLSPHPKASLSMWTLQAPHPPPM